MKSLCQLNKLCGVYDFDYLGFNTVYISPKHKQGKDLALKHPFNW